MGKMDHGESWTGQEAADFQPSKIDKILTTALLDKGVKARVLNTLGA